MEGRNDLPEDWRERHSRDAEQLGFTVRWPVGHARHRAHLQTENVVPDVAFKILRTVI